MSLGPAVSILGRIGAFLAKGAKFALPIVGGLAAGSVITNATTGPKTVEYNYNIPPGWTGNLNTTNATTPTTTGDWWSNLGGMFGGIMNVLMMAIFIGLMGRMIR